MANAAKLALTNPARGLLIGYPGSGKTGAFVALANAGLKLRVLAFDKAGNMQTLLSLVNKDKLQNIDIVMLEDKLRMGGKTVEVDGAPEAFARAFKLLDRWKYKEADGTEVDLGRSKDWGLDTLVVLDSLTAMGDAAMRRSRFLNNGSILSTSDRTYGVAMAEQDSFIERLMSSDNPHHTFVTAHLKIIGPRDLRKGEDDLTEKIKREIAEVVPTKLFPSALGWQLPQQIGRHFPIILEAERRISQQKKVRHVLKTVSNLPLDLRLPAPDLPSEMDTSDALVKVFDAVSPSWRAAVENAEKAGSPSAQTE